MISLIIPTFNKASRLSITLYYLTFIELHEKVELIIVNDGSTDKTIEIIEAYKKSIGENYFRDIKLINVLNGGRSYARNIGIQNATYEFLVFIDDDIIVSPGLIREYLKVLQNNYNYAIHGKIYGLPFVKFFDDPVTGQMKNTKYVTGILASLKLQHYDTYDDLYNNYLKKNARLSEFEKTINYIYENSSLQDSKVRWLGLVGANFGIRKEVIQNVGGFDIHFGKEWGCEDLDLGYRLYRSNVKFIYNNDACVYHISHYRENFEEEHKKNMGYFISKYQDKRLNIVSNYFEHNLSSSELLNNLLNIE